MNHSPNAPIASATTPTPIVAFSATGVDESRSWTEPEFHEVVSAAGAAPSADNNQPWLFRQTETGFDVLCDNGRRLPSDVDGMFDYLSIGAAIENALIKLTEQGRTAEITYCDSGAGQDGAGNSIDHVAKLTVSAVMEGTAVDPLSEYVTQRCTTRTPFSKKTINESELSEVASALDSPCSANVRWLNDRAPIASIASLVALSDSLRFRYRDFHEELHRQLRLSTEHAEQTRDGLDYRTLGLPPGASTLLRFLGPWKRMRLLNRFGAATLMALPSIRLIRCSGAIGFLYAKDNTPASLIEGGRAMQRIWLQATCLGYSIHPLGSLPIFLANERLPAELEPIGAKLRGRAAVVVPKADGFLQLAFRIGRTNATPKCRSLRLEPSTVIVGSTNLS